MVEHSASYLAIFGSDGEGENDFYIYDKCNENINCHGNLGISFALPDGIS